MSNNKQVLKLIATDFISVNHYLAYRAVKGKAMSYKTKEAKDFQKKFEKYVAEQVKEQGWKTDLNPYQHYYADFVFYFPRTRMDSNNYYKVILDSLTDTELIWDDDDLCCERCLRTCIDNINPRIEITIYKTDFIGIFDNEDQLNDFEDRCKTCKRYGNNCSILRKAKEGRVQEEVNELACSKYKEK